MHPINHTGIHFGIPPPLEERNVEALLIDSEARSAPAHNPPTTSQSQLRRMPTISTTTKLITDQSNKAYPESFRKSTSPPMSKINVKTSKNFRLESRGANPSKLDASNSSGPPSMAKKK